MSQNISLFCMHLAADINHAVLMPLTKTTPSRRYKNKSSWIMQPDDQGRQTEIKSSKSDEMFSNSTHATSYLIALLIISCFQFIL